MKVVINARIGGFCLSKGALDALRDIAPHLFNAKGNPASLSFNRHRHDESLVHIVESMGEKANGPGAMLEVIDIPDGIEYGIFNYDGIETVYEKGHIWG